MVANLKHYAAGPSGPDAITKGRVSIDSASVPTQRKVETTFTFPGCKVGDVAWASPLAALDTGVMYGGARVVDTDIVGITIGNLTTAAVDPVAVSFDVAILHG